MKIWQKKKGSSGQIKMVDFLKNERLDSNPQAQQIRKDILNLVSEYTKISHKEEEFIPGKSFVSVSGRVFDQNDIQMLVSSSLDFWLTSGRFNKEFEKQLGEFLQINFAITTNSGSSANLLALTSLTSEQLDDRALMPGDEVITLAAGFPTTVNPILQNNLVPVFVDVDLSTYAINLKSLKNAISNKTKAIMIAHTLGNPHQIEEVQKIAKENNLWLVEDCCDALGSKFNRKNIGTFGDLATFSFYPAHQITMGEGGAVVTDNPKLKRIVESLRDWGRDCFCPTGVNDTCGKRFEWKLGELPFGYDHKYTYSHVGYNLKITDMQAAVGLSQLKKLPQFIKKRKENFHFLKENLSKHKEFLILPEETENAEPSWFGFPIIVRKNLPFTMNDLIGFLASKLIDTRPVFAGNITKQPYFKNKKYRIANNLDNTDMIMHNGFWIGVYPGLDDKRLDYIVKQFNNFFKTKEEGEND